MFIVKENRTFDNYFGRYPGDARASNMFDTFDYDQPARSGQRKLVLPLRDCAGLPRDTTG